MDGRPIEQRIVAVFETLTGNERRLADVVLATRGGLAGFTAAELAAQARVSTATASRFFQRLGYRTYHDARRLNRDQPSGSPLHELASAPLLPPDADDFTRHIAQDMRNLARTVELLDHATIQRGVRLLAEARTIWVIGFRNSMALAGYARALLVTIKPDVRLLPTPGMTLAEDIASFGAGDCLLALGFRRRPQAMRDILAIAAERALPSLLLTDLTAARTARIASIVLRCHTRGHGMFDSYAAVMSVLNHIGTALARELGEPALARLRDIEALHLRLAQSAIPTLPAGSRNSE